MHRFARKSLFTLCSAVLIVSAHTSTGTASASKKKNVNDGENYAGIMKIILNRKILIV